MQVSKALLEMGCKIEPVGSRVTCNPPPLDTDADYLVEVTIPDNWAPIDALLRKAGFRLEDSYESLSDEFESWRKDEINLIVTEDPTFAGLFRVATALCKERNVMNRNERVRIFQHILYGK